MHSLTPTCMQTRTLQIYAPYLSFSKDTVLNKGRTSVDSGGTLETGVNTKDTTTNRKGID